MIKFFENNEQVAEILGDHEALNKLLNQIMIGAYNMAVEHSLRTVPQLVMNNLGFYSDINDKVRKFFEKNPKYGAIKHLFRMKIAQLSALHPDESVEVLLERAQKLIDVEFGL